MDYGLLIYVTVRNITQTARVMYRTKLSTSSKYCYT